MQETLSEIIAHHATLGAAEDQQQLIALLQDVQENCGGALSRPMLAQIASVLHMREPLLAALIRRIPSLRLAEAPHRLEICGSCEGARALAAHVEKRYGVKNGGISSEGGFAFYVTGCMKNCRSGPSVRWDCVLHDEADMALIDRLVRGK